MEASSGGKSKLPEPQLPMKRFSAILVALVTTACAIAASSTPSPSPEKSAVRVTSPSPAPKTDDSVLQTFRKYFKTYKETPLKVEAVLSLEGVEEPAVVETLTPLFKDSESEVQRAVVRILGGFKERPPVDALLATLKAEKNDAVRAGVLESLAKGKYKDCGPAVVACLPDKSWIVRRHAILALAAANDPSVADKIIPLCDDPEIAVRCDAIDALTQFQSPLVVAKAIAALPDPDRRVRATAIKTLTKIRSKDAVEPLLARINVEEGVLVPDIAEALANLTGKEFGGEISKWNAWWTEVKATFVLPTPEAIAYLRAKREATTGKTKFTYDKSKVVYHSIETTSKSIMFVIDVSGSMEAEVTEKDRFSDGNYPSFQRIDIVKTELMRVIDRLEPNVNFNIIAFATKVDPWKAKLMPANVLNKSSAKDWVKGLVAIGGASKEDLATAGLVGSANLEMGKTNTYGALMGALNIKTGKDAPRTGGETRDYKVDVDTVFFLSDGRPTVGDFTDPDDILREVKAANELRKVKIHTLAIGEFQKDFMKKLADQNEGTFVDLGK
jgi:HEAT repeat protein